MYDPEKRDLEQRFRDERHDSQPPPYDVPPSLDILSPEHLASDGHHRPVTPKVSFKEDGNHTVRPTRRRVAREDSESLTYEPDDGKIILPGLRNNFRYLLLGLSLLCLTSISSNVFTFNFAVICMGSNATTQAGPRHDYTTMEQTYLIWAVGVGSMLGTFPFGYSYTRYGARYFFTGAGITSALATAIQPIAADWGLGWVAVMRFIQGIAFSANFAAVGLFSSIWSSLLTVGFFVSMLTCYTPLSSASTNFVSGFLCHTSVGWPLVYYAHGAICLALHIAFWLLYTDAPNKNRHVTGKEVSIIERGKRKEEIEVDTYVPYREIFTTQMVWMLWFNAFAGIATNIFLLTYTPIYLNKVHEYSVEQTGLLASLSTVVMVPTRVALGMVSDRFTCMSERWKMNIFNAIAQSGPALCYLAIALAPVSWHTFAIVMLTITNILYAAAGSGFYKCSTLTCRQYSHFVIANMQFIKCITLIVAPLFYSLCVSDETSSSQWGLMFYLMAGWLVVATIWFAIISHDEPLPFTRSRRRSTHTPSLRRKSTLKAVEHLGVEG